MKDLVLYSWTIFLAMDQNQVYGVHSITVRGTVPLSLTTMDALILMMWESAVSQVDFGVAIKLDHHFSSFIIASCLDGQIKLMEGYSETSGHVEICSNQRWELISGNYWGEDEARVACNALGYTYSGMNYLCNVDICRTSVKTFSLKC